MTSRSVLIPTLGFALACGGAGTVEAPVVPPPPPVPDRHEPEPPPPVVVVAPGEVPAFEALPTSWTRLTRIGGNLVVWHHCDAETPVVAIENGDGERKLVAYYGQDSGAWAITGLAQGAGGWDLALGGGESARIEPEVPDWSLVRWTGPYLSRDDLYAPTSRLEGYEQVVEPLSNCWEEEEIDTLGLDSLPKTLWAKDGDGCSNHATIEVRPQERSIALDQGGDRREWPVTYARAEGGHVTITVDAGGSRGASFVHDEAIDAWRVRFPDFEEQVFVDVTRCAP